MKLTDYEENLNTEELFLKWLIEEKIDFIKLSNQYTNYLEKIKRQQTREKTRYARLLAQYLQFGKLKDKDSWVKDKTVGTLYAYEQFKTAPIYKEFEDFIIERNINTDLETLDYITYKGE